MRGTEPDPAGLFATITTLNPLDHPSSCTLQAPKFVPFTPGWVRPWQGRCFRWCQRAECWKSPPVPTPSCLNPWSYLGVWAKISWEHSQ